MSTSLDLDEAERLDLPWEADLSQYEEEEIEKDDWVRRAPKLEKIHFLNSVWENQDKPLEVAIVKEGLLQQAESMTKDRFLITEDAFRPVFWTGLVSRENVRCGLEQPRKMQKCSETSGWIDRSFGDVEHCRLCNIEYLYTTLPIDAQKYDAYWTTSEMPELNPVRCRMRSYAVRLHLQRCTHDWKPLHQLAVIDCHTHCGVGDWIVPRERYEHTAKRWKKGDRISMSFWYDCNQLKDSHGEVCGPAKRAKHDRLGNSPWATIQVEWDLPHCKQDVSPWELEPGPPKPLDDYPDQWMLEFEAAAEIAPAAA